MDTIDRQWLIDHGIPLFDPDTTTSTIQLTAAQADAVLRAWADIWDRHLQRPAFSSALSQLNVLIGAPTLSASQPSQSESFLWDIYSRLQASGRDADRAEWMQLGQRLVQNMTSSTVSIPDSGWGLGSGSQVAEQSWIEANPVLFVILIVAGVALVGLTSWWAWKHTRRVGASA